MSKATWISIGVDDVMLSALEDFTEVNGFSSVAESVMMIVFHSLVDLCYLDDPRKSPNVGRGEIS